MNRIAAFALVALLFLFHSSQAFQAFHDSGHVPLSCRTVGSSDGFTINLRCAVNQGGDLAHQLAMVKRHNQDYQRIQRGSDDRDEKARRSLSPYRLKRTQI